MTIRATSTSASRLASALIGLTVLVQAIQAAPVTATFPTPTLDRWNYRFASGNPTDAPLFSPFGSPFQNSFDNRDGEHLVGFDTASAIPAGQPAANYRILSARLTLRVSRDMAFTYDPTSDAFNTYLATTPGFTPDADPGRPIELFGVGYRGGFSAQTYTQSSPYTNSPQPLSSLRDRNAFPIIYDNAGQPLDVANNVTDAFEARPFAVGQAATNAFQPVPVAPGSLVPVNTDFTFTIDLSNPAAVKYLREGLALGKVNLMATSIFTTTQQGSANPAFYTKQYAVSGFGDPGFAPAKLELSACVGSPADWNCSGTVTVQDLFDFLASWFSGQADFNASGTTTVQDLFDFLASWFTH